jgi:hypothetical protein
MRNPVEPREPMLGTSGLKARGWTPSMVKVLLGQPDATAKNPHYSSGAPMQLYAVARIKAAEDQPEFASLKVRAAARSAGAAKGVQTQTKSLMQQIEAMKISVEVLPPNRVLSEAIGAYNEWSERDEPATHKSDSVFLRRITVNYIRHNLTNYDEGLETTVGRVGKSAAKNEIRRRVYSAIAAAYPAYADECEQQLELRRQRQQEAAEYRAGPI